jgi:hypothetical protein
MINNLGHNKPSSHLVTLLYTFVAAIFFSRLLAVKILLLYYCITVLQYYGIKWQTRHLVYTNFEFLFYLAFSHYFSLVPGEGC